MGWERVNYFGPAAPYTFGRPGWQETVDAEVGACRSEAALFDQTSFAKFTLKGPEATAALQWLCTADVDVEVGRVVYTGMLNDRGGYESDLTVTRVSADEYLIVTGSAQATRDFDHISRGIGERRAVLVDVTSAYAVFGLMGPESRNILRTVSKAELGEFGTSRLIDLGHATVRASRVTYVGELGWELYVPAEFAVTVYERLLATGVRQAGHYAIEAMRLEKGYRAWGRELAPTSPRPRRACCSPARRAPPSGAWTGSTTRAGRSCRSPRRRTCGEVNPCSWTASRSATSPPPPTVPPSAGPWRSAS
ncbi:hypothetical protein [Nonomuraea sp. NPDC003754]